MPRAQRRTGLSTGGRLDGPRKQRSCERLPMRLLCWNMARGQAHWSDITNDDGHDVAPLQEAVPPPTGVVLQTIPSSEDRWVTVGGN